MGLDDRLLNAQDDNSDDSSADRAGALNEARRNSTADAEEQSGRQNSEEPQSLRQAVQTEKREQAQTNSGKDGQEDGPEGSGGSIRPSVSSPIRKGTSRLLRQSWINLIDSFGATLIWINIHVFLGQVLGNKMFCKLGEEWTDANPLPAAVPGKEKLSKSVGTVEKMGVGCVDFGCLMSCLFQLAILMLIAGLIDNPLRIFASIFKSIFPSWSQWE